MTRSVKWMPDALEELGQILEYVALDDPDLALRLIGKIEAAAARLGDLPTGRPGRVNGTYEKSLPALRYIIVYAMDQTPDGTLDILHVIHAARNWPRGRWPN